MWKVLAAVAAPVVLFFVYPILRQLYLFAVYFFYKLPRVRRSGVPCIHDKGFRYKNFPWHFLFGETFDLSGPHFRNAVDTMGEVAADAGTDIVIFGRSLNDSNVCIAVCTPAAAKEVADRDGTDFVKGDVWDMYAKYCMGEGVLFNYGEKWRLSRKLLTPLFHFATLKSYVPNFDELSEAAIIEIEGTKGEPVHPQHIFGRYAMHSIVGLAFGNCIDPEEMTQRYHKLNDVFIPFMRKVCMYGKVADKLPFSETFTVRKNRAELEQLIYNAMAKLREGDAYKRADPETGRDDLLRVLMRAQDEHKDIMTDELIVNEGRSFLFAGYDTTSQNLTHTMAYLSQNPDAQEILHKEVLEVVGRRPFTREMVEKLTWTRKAFDETMRVVGVGGLTRVVTKDCELAGHKLYKDTEVYIWQPLVNMHPSGGWKKPGEWSLDNWDSDDRHPHGFIGFWVGQRNCIGRNFAHQEGIMLLAKIVRDFKIVAASEYFQINPSVTAANEGFRVRFVPRE